MDKTWGDVTAQNSMDSINRAYQEIVFFKRNLFNLPSGKAGRDFLKEFSF